MRLAWKSHIGLMRETNEDFILVNEKLRIILLADGMGGRKAGETASEMAALEAFELLQKNLDSRDYHEVPELLELAVQKAHNSIKLKAFSDNSLGKMGTTLLQAVVRKGKAFICNVGDSRAYIMKSSLEQITKDHAIVDRFISDILMAGELRPLGGYRLLTQAVGASEQIRPDIHVVEVEKGDILLFCSDGLTDMLNKGRIEDIIKKHRADLHETVKKLIEYANHSGGIDNISLVLLEIL